MAEIGSYEAVIRRWTLKPGTVFTFQIVKCRNRYPYVRFINNLILNIMCVGTIMTHFNDIFQKS